MPQPFDLPPQEKLEIIRRLDCFHPWNSLDQERQCRRCGAIFSGAQIGIQGGSPGFGPLRLHCPTEGCCAVPIEWMLLEEKVAAKRRAVQVEHPQSVITPQAAIDAPSHRRRRSGAILSFLRVLPPVQ